MVDGKGMIDDHSFCSAIKKSVGTDFLSRLFSNQGISEGDRRRLYIFIVPLGTGSESRVSNRTTFYM